MRLTLDENHGHGCFSPWSLKSPPLIIYICFYFLEESTSRVPFKIIWGLVGALALAKLVTIIVIFAKQIRRKRKENVIKVY